MDSMVNRNNRLIDVGSELTARTTFLLKFKNVDLFVQLLIYLFIQITVHNSPVFIKFPLPVKISFAFIFKLGK